MSSILTVSEEINESDFPKINEIWIWSVVVLGFIGCLALIFIIFIGFRNHHLNVHSQNMPKILHALVFILWIFNFIACFEWALFRTNLFINLTRKKCIIIYASNYLFYLMAKYCMHCIFLSGLYFIFKNTPFEINVYFINSIIIVITIFFICFIPIFIQICIKNVTIGGPNSGELKICTLYNSSSNPMLSTYDKIWPFLQDLLVGLIVFAIFIKKIIDLSTYKRFKYDVEIEQLVRKLSILGMIAICSTFILYTFAVPFYPNITFLLPLDATLNSLCIILLIDYSHFIYIKLCFGCDLCFTKILKHHNDDIELTVGSFRSRGVSISQISEEYKSKKYENVSSDHSELSNHYEQDPNASFIQEMNEYKVNQYEADLKHSQPNNFRMTPQLAQPTQSQSTIDMDDIILDEVVNT